MQDANHSSVYEIRSRNPIHEPKPFLDSANNSIEAWEVIELEMSPEIIRPVAPPIANRFRDLFKLVRTRMNRFFDEYKQDEE
jgi:hypothetical protein